jgi:hypothetical protein
VDPPTIFLEEVSGDGEEPLFDLVCAVCGGRFSLVSDEGMVVQVLAFSARHRHDRD